MTCKQNSTSTPGAAAAGRAFATLCGLSVLLSSVAGASAPPPESDWHFDFTVYAHIAGVSAETRQQTGSGTISADFGDLLSNLKGGFFGIGDVRWRRFGLLADIAYLKLGDKESLSGPFFTRSKVEFGSLVSTVAGYYRVVDAERFGLDATAGVRIYHVDIDQRLSGGIAPEFVFKRDETLADPVFGMRGRANIAGGLFGTALFDVGGGGSSDLVWQAYGGLGYALSERVSLHLGYRHMSWDFDDRVLLEQQTSGPLIGATFHFR